ncbi:MAG: hypothetical protein KC646_16745 [Candidatus Cloacimonetes bacterium]|nr:hypothetical protein [Candidatus Cloacimonadota bacterium]
MKKPKVTIGKDMANLLKTRFKTKIKKSKKIYSKKDRATNKKLREDRRSSFFYGANLLSIIQFFIITAKTPSNVNLRGF